ncbi:MAG: hypothetical protein R2755_18595 [Acidimicrobiales bacterium]
MDTLGMRPSQSHYETLLDAVFVPDDRIGAVVDAGAQDHPFLGAMDVRAPPLMANVYTGIAERR